ncbi:MAG: alpha/beta fold hydrolase [Steroidobacteraceae bacterium]
MTHSAADIAERGTFVCADGGRLRYSTAGAGEPVVLIHGLGLDAAMWDPQWPVLQRGFRTIRYDVRGFGDSTLPQGPYSHSADLHELLDFLDARPAHVVGLSMGGQLALRFALEHPDAVQSLTLIDAALPGYRWSDAWRRSMSEIQNAAKNGDLQAAKRLWLAHALFAPLQRDPRLAAALAAMVERYSAWHWHNADPVRKPAAPTALAAVSSRTLVIVGELDLPDFKSIAAQLAAEIPRATLHTVAGAGHMANMEAPAMVNALLLEHLRGCAGSGGCAGSD